MSDRFQIVPVTDSIFQSIDARGFFSCANCELVIEPGKDGFD